MSGFDVSRVNVDELIEQADVNKDGIIDYREFVAALHNWLQDPSNPLFGITLTAAESVLVASADGEYATAERTGQDAIQGDGMNVIAISDCPPPPTSAVCVIIERSDTGEVRLA